MKRWPSLGKVWEKLCHSKAKRIELVFYRIVNPSIKDAERDRRSNSERGLPIKISGPNQQRLSDFLKALRNDCFKQELVKFGHDFEWKFWTHSANFNPR